MTTLDAPRMTRWWPLVLLASMLFVLAAVALEVAGGANANSEVPGWAHLVPIAWAPPVRVAWWLAVAASAATFRVGLRRVGIRTNRLADIVTVAPFVAFSAGIALGASWATWH